MLESAGEQQICSVSWVKKHILVINKGFKIAGAVVIGCLACPRVAVPPAQTGVLHRLQGHSSGDTGDTAHCTAALLGTPVTATFLLHD